MSEQPIRVKLLADAADVLKTLPSMGKLMINSKSGGATHERIGVVEQVEVRDGWIYFSGSEHHSRIDLSAIASLLRQLSAIRRRCVLRSTCQPSSRNGRAKCRTCVRPAALSM